MKYNGKLAFEVLGKIRTEAMEYEKTKKLSYVLEIIGIVEGVVPSVSAKGRWTQSLTSEVYSQLQIISEDDCSTQELKGELFRINVALAYILRNLVKKAGLSVSKMPRVNLFPSPYLSLERTEELIQSLDDFHLMLAVMTEKRPNFKTPKEQLFPSLVLAMIALDGVLFGGADRKLVLMKKEDVYLGMISSIDVRVGKESSRPIVYKRYPVTNYVESSLKFVLKRTPNEGYIFPEEWRVKGHKKTIRRRDLEGYLVELWHKTFPHRNIPKYLNVPFWIKISAVSMEILGVPYICIASCRNIKLRGAQIPRDNRLEKSTRTSNRNSATDEFSSLLEIQQSLDDYDKKDKSKKTKKELIGRIKTILSQGSDSEQTTQNERLLVNWLKWFLSQNMSDDVTISTIKGYTYTLSNRVLPFLGERSFDQLQKDEWEKLFEDVATDPDYSTSSRRQSITHLKRLYVYLKETLPNLPAVDLNDYRFRVTRDYPECPVIFPCELDRQLRSLRPDSSEWVAIVLAYYCGLRCEEICNVGVDDFQDESRLSVKVSKIASSRRTLPWGWLIPEPFYSQLISIIDSRKQFGYECLIHDGNGFLLNTDTLSKRVRRFLTSKRATVQKLHGLRHGFASIQLIRYFMLVDSEFRSLFLSGNIVAGIDPSAPIFSDDMMEKLAITIGGMPWVSSLRKDGNCISVSTDLVPISKIMGHASRITTIENYYNALTFIQRHYLNGRLERIQNARWSFDS